MDTKSIEHEERSAWNQIEFALNFLCPSAARLERLKCQLESKLIASHGEVHYTIGLDSKGETLGLTSADTDLAISTMRLIAAEIGAHLIVLSKQNWESGMAAQVLIRKCQFQPVGMDIRVALLGESQVGKSTMVGVLSKGVKENGKGSARNAILQHLHEKKLGFTASVTQHLVGFDCEGRPIKKKKAWTELLAKSSKLISLIDLPGKEKYRNTMLYGLISQSPEYCVLMVDPSSMNTQSSLDYISLISALNLPFFLIFTKSDKSSAHDLDCAVDFFRAELCRREKILMMAESQEDSVLFSRTFLQENIVPVFVLSFKTAKNVDLLVGFLNLLPVRNNWEVAGLTEFYLEKWYIRDGNSILCGMMTKGKAKIGDKLMLGPDNQGAFTQVTVLGICVKMVAVHSVSAGQFCSFQVAGNLELRRGMTLIDVNSQPKAALEFECIIWTIDSFQGNRVVKESYKPLVYTQTITQCVYVVSGPKIVVPNVVMKFKLHFLYHPEYITHGSRLMIKDTFMTAVGTITSISIYK